MTNDDQDIAQRLQRISRQVDDRMSGLRIGSGQLSAPDLASRLTELERRAMIERNIRELELREREVQAAIKLWSTTFDAKREEEARAARAGSRTGADGGGLGVASAESRQPRGISEPGTASGNIAGSESQPNSEQRQNARPAQNASRAQQQFVPLPKIVAITGGGDTGLRAALLVPYVGELNATEGTNLPARRRVERITPQAVIISDPQLGEVELGFGDTVPLSPQTQAMGRAEDATAAQRGMPIVMPPSIMMTGAPPQFVPPSLPGAASMGGRALTPLDGRPQE